MSNLDQNPEHRKRFVEDILKKKGLFVNEKPQTPEQRIQFQAMTLWTEVKRRAAYPLLKALKSKDQYIPAGTQQLFYAEFRRGFAAWSKDELVALISIMHTEELERECSQIVEQGVFGDQFGKTDI